MFAERLKQLRRQRNISQQMLSIQLGVNQTTISCWEIANREPSYEMLARIADLFGVSADYLIGRCESPLGMSPSHTPYIEATVHEQALVRAYRHASRDTRAAVDAVLSVPLQRGSN